MAITIKAGNQTIIGGHLPSIDILDVFAPTGDICTIDYIFQVGETILPMVSQLLEINFTDSQGVDKKLFVGPIEIVDFAQSPGGHRLSITATDLTKWMDSKLVAGIFTESTVTVMVAAILAQYAPSFNRTTYIDATDTTSILPHTFDWNKVSECLQQIAEERGYVWWVDFAGAVHFVPKGLIYSSAPIINIVPSTNTVIGDFKFSVRVDELKNTIFVKEFFFRSPNLSFEPGEDAFIASIGRDISGETQPLIHLREEPYDLSELVVEVSENGGAWETYTIRDIHTEATVGDDTTFLAGSAYVDAQGRKITIFHKDGIDTAFPTTSLVRTQYRPLQKPTIPEISVDVFSILKFADLETGSITNDGEHQFMVSFGSLEFGGTNPIITLLDYITSILSDYAWPIVEGSFTTFYDGNRNIGFHEWAAGQAFLLKEEAWNLFDWKEWVLNGVKSPLVCYIRSVKTTVINPEVLKFDITFSNVLRS